MTISVRKKKKHEKMRCFVSESRAISLHIVHDRQILLQDTIPDADEDYVC